MHILPHTAGSEIEYSHIIVSRNGKRMVSVSRTPNAQLVFWEVATVKPGVAAAAVVVSKIVEAPLGTDDVFYASFNPRSKRQFVLGNQNALTIWQVDMRFEQYSLTASEYAIEMDSAMMGADVGREILCHCWTADDRLICGTPYVVNHFVNCLLIFFECALISSPMPSVLSYVQSR